MLREKEECPLRLIWHRVHRLLVDIRMGISSVLRELPKCSALQEFSRKEPKQPHTVEAQYRKGEGEASRAKATAELKPR